MLANLYSLASALPPPPTASFTSPGTSLQYPSQSRTRKSLTSCSFRTASAALSFPPPIPPPPSHTFLISFLRTTPSRPPPIGIPTPNPTRHPTLLSPPTTPPSKTTHPLHRLSQHANTPPPKQPNSSSPAFPSTQNQPPRPLLPTNPTRPSKSTLQHQQCPRSSIHPISFPPVFMPPPQLLLSPLHLSPLISSSSSLFSFSLLPSLLLFSIHLLEFSLQYQFLSASFAIRTVSVG